VEANLSLLNDRYCSGEGHCLVAKASVILLLLMVRYNVATHCLPYSNESELAGEERDGVTASESHVTAFLRSSWPNFSPQLSLVHGMYEYCLQQLLGATPVQVVF
jgi:hypothetical protein